jgi:hypothetical protein
MMKASIPLERLEKVAMEAGCTVTVMASYVKITRGESENCLFVAKTKNVSRIDLGGFNVPDPLITRDLGGESHGSVHQQFHTDMLDAQFLANYREVCSKLDKYTKHEKQPKARPHAFRGSTNKRPDQMILVKVDETPQQTVDRLVAKLALIRKIAKERNMPVSKKTEVEIAEQLEKARKEISK